MTAYFLGFMGLFVLFLDVDADGEAEEEGEGDEEGGGDQEEERGGKRKGPRVNSSKLWDLGPVTSDEGFGMIADDKSAKDQVAKEAEDRRIDKRNKDIAKNAESLADAHECMLRLREAEFDVDKVRLS
eukprot:9478950-Pyramimonas_sp.AAC.1